MTAPTPPTVSTARGVLWHGSCVVHAVDGTGPTDWQAAGISIDTRTLQRGDLFVALQGPLFDGHDFIEAAVALGASAIVVQDLSKIILNPLHPTIVVPDTFQALKKLAVAARARFQGRLLALTGSVGKTTVKDGLAHLLSRQGQTCASWHSLNNHLGVPLSLARLPMDAQYAVFEVGMNHAGEIADLIGMIAPHVVLITQVSYQHGQFFAHLEDIVTAKAEIFSAPGPLLGIIPHDSPHYAALRRQGPNVTKWMTFGEHPESCVRLVGKEHTDHGTHITLRLQDQTFQYHWPMRAVHTMSNSLAMVAGAVALGADPHQIMQDLQTMTPSPGRGNHRIIGGIGIIDDTYNAAPASMQAALMAFADQSLQARGNPLGMEARRNPLGMEKQGEGHQPKETQPKRHQSKERPISEPIAEPISEKQQAHAGNQNNGNQSDGMPPEDKQNNGKRYIILGEMRELGAQSHACHSTLIPLIQACGADGVWLCGPAFLPFLQDIPVLCGHGLTISDLMPSILKTLQPGDWVLIKGANSMRTFAVIQALAEREKLQNSENSAALNHRETSADAGDA